jgi:DNA-directed RNA polymerase specialized sigma24 family protein
MKAISREQTAVGDPAGSAAAVSRALARLTDADLLRLQALARVRARGLPSGIGWADLLHEALARTLDGSRVWPSGVPLLVFLAGVMRSICDELWRRRRREAELIAFGDAATRDGADVASPAADQERVLAAAEAVAAIHRLFAGDAVAMCIVSGMAAGLAADEIRVTHGLSAVEYDTARRRMRRALIRAGLTWGEE